MKIIIILLLFTVSAAAVATAASVKDPSSDIDDELAAPERDRRQSGSHTKEEIMAQAMCQSIAVKRHLSGWVYAVERNCGSGIKCTAICASSYLHVQDSQTVHRSWSTIGAFHVYKGRPATAPGTDTNPVIGLKTYWSPNMHENTSCGPNFCCCHA